MFSSMSGLQKSYLKEAKIIGAHSPEDITEPEYSEGETVELDSKHKTKEERIAEVESEIEELKSYEQGILDKIASFKEQYPETEYTRAELEEMPLEKRPTEYWDLDEFHRATKGLADLKAKLKTLEKKLEHLTVDEFTLDAEGKPKVSAAQAAWKLSSLANLSGESQVGSNERKARIERLLAKRDALAEALGNPTMKQIKTRLGKIGFDIENLSDDIDQMVAEFEAELAKLPADKRELAELELKKKNKDYLGAVVELKRLKKEQEDLYNLEEMNKINPKTGLSKIQAEISALGSDGDPAYDERTDSLGRELSDKRRKSAAGSAKGLNSRERQLLSIENLGLMDNTSLVYKQKPDAANNKVLSFDDMIINATNAMTDTEDRKEPAESFKLSVNLFNLLMREVFSGTKNSARITNEKPIKKLFEKMASGGRVELDPDLIKICWLFLGGNSAVEKAKSNPLFVKAVQKLERAKTSGITNPISEINSVDNIFSTEVAKGIFADLRDKVLHEEDIKRISEYTTGILDAPNFVYSGEESETVENIADTLYYAIINSFGTPSDKIKLLKLAGSGSSAGFLTPEAKKVARKALESFEDFFLGARPLPSKGRKHDKGDKTKLVKLGSVLRALIKTTGSAVRDDSEVAKPTENVADLIVAKALDFSSPESAVREAFQSGASIERLKTLLSHRFETVLTEYEEIKDSYATAGNTEKESSYAAAITSAKADLDSTTEAIATLQQGDIDALASVFKASEK